ncbi:MAG: TIGR03943 family putative permease subunit [Desertimonas sp.]
MSRDGRGALLVALGAMVAQLVWSGDFSSFVQLHMRWPLGAAAIALLALGLNDLVIARLGIVADAARRAAPVVGGLMMLPVAVLIAVAPTTLGSAAARRAGPPPPTATDEAFAPLPDDGRPIEMRVFEFMRRARSDQRFELEGRHVVVEAFVVNDDRYPDGVLLSRFLVSCCAADALPVQIAVPTTLTFDDDTWVRATIEWDPVASAGEQRWLVVATLVEYTVLTAAPAAPYESPY